MNTREGFYRMIQSQLKITSNFQSFHDGGIASSHVTFPHSFSITPPPPNKPMARYGVSVVNQWAEGRQASPVTLPVCVTVGQCYFIKTSDFYTFKSYFNLDNSMKILAW